MKRRKGKSLWLLVVGFIVATFFYIPVQAGSLIWPVPGHTTLSNGFHAGNAIDISDGSIAGANVVAAMGGKVINTFTCTIQHKDTDGDCYGFGTGVVINGNDGRVYQYAHMMGNSIPSNIYVGASVSAGQLLGKVGKTGRATGYHLHFGISIGKYWYNSGINPQNESYVYTTQLSYSEIKVTFVDSWNAGLYGKIQNPGRGVVSQVGAYVWDSNGSLVVDHIENCGLSYSTINQNLNIVGEALPKGLKSGARYTFQLFAISNGKRYYSDKGSFTTAGNSDTQKPQISNVEIRDLSGSGYTVVCKVTDNIGVTNVKFPSWSLKNGQDDLIWGVGTRSGDTFSYRVNVSAHKRDRGNYRTHIYAYDAAGNYSIYQINAIYVTTTKYRNVTNGTYEIVSALNNSKAIDIYDASKSDCAKTILFDRHGGANQKFKISYYGNGYYRLVASHSGKTLDVNGASSKSGTILQQYYWNRSKAQLFRFESAGNGYYYIRSKVGTYIDAKGASTTNGTPVWMYKLNRRNSQKWKLIYNA